MAAVAQQETLFERKMNSQDISKSDLNNLIMDYLIKKGYPAAAEKFASEANIPLREDQTHIESRVQIRMLILRGELEQAIQEINELDVELLDQDKKLHFALLRLQLIEMIKKSFDTSDQSIIAEAIDFASHTLAPYAPLHDEFRLDLERALALLIVPKETWSNPQAAGGFGALAELVRPSLRRDIAEQVNEAILKSQGMSAEPNINYLTKTRAWAEQQAREKNIELPGTLSLDFDDEHGQSQHRSPDNGDTEMSENGAAVDTAEPDLTRYTNIST